MKPQKVDVFIIEQPQPSIDRPPRPTPPQGVSRTATASDGQVRIVPNDTVPTTAKKPAFDHLRPRYVVQRTAPPVVLKPSPMPQRPAELRPQPRLANPMAHVATRPIQQSESALQPAPVPVPPKVATWSVQTETKPSGPAKKRTWRKVLLLTLATPCAVAMSLMFQSVAAGEVLIGLYAVVALVRRIASRTTFMLAFVSVTCILALLLVRPDPLLMKNFAIYAFLFMLVGTVSLTVETRY